jgi:hypothetical protein
MCIARKALDETCGDAEPCLETLRCSGGHCVAKLPVGAPCASNDECGSDAPVCDPYAGNVCGPAVVFTGASPVCRAFGKT